MPPMTPGVEHNLAQSVLERAADNIHANPHIVLGL
jgi:hypothetical protein